MCPYTHAASCLSYIPEKGTVGASGDLAPLSHLALGLMGEGKMWSPESGWASAKDVLDSHHLKPITLGPKEVRASTHNTNRLLLIDLAIYIIIIYSICHNCMLCVKLIYF